MEIKNLHFYDRNGYELNFDFNETRNCWEGNIYLPPVSIGLYSNSTVFVLEEVYVPKNNNSYKKHFKESETEKSYVFPRPSDDVKNNKIEFRWDSVNNFVDEIFMFSFDQNYKSKSHTALSYNYNDGPDCETLLVNRFDTYEIDLTDKNLYFDVTNEKSKRVLPIHVAFSSPIQFDGNTYKRTLVMLYDNKEIARITYFAESIEEDERLRIWNYNLGYDLKPEDTIIFKNSDIEEPNPDYKLLNEKRKELLMEGHNIYPYVGSYKALLGAIKFFGYDNLNIIEFWRNVNPNDPNFGKFVMSPKYVLSNRECTFVKDTPTDFNENYRKGNKLAFAYTINTPTEDVDLYELPYVKEESDFTFGEILIKLIALRKKLNKEFMPSTSKIIDIIGEASYFGIQLIKNGFTYKTTEQKKEPIKLSISSFPNDSIRITDDRFFNDYIFEQTGFDKNKDIEKITILNNIKDVKLSNIIEQSFENKSDVNDINLSESEKSELYRQYHKDITYTFLKTEDVIDNDLYKIKHVPNYLISENDNDYVEKLGNNISAKVVLSNTTFHEKTFNELPYPFKSIGLTFNNTSILNDFQFDWEDKEYDNKVYLKWCVTFSDNQVNEIKDTSERRKYYESIIERYNNDNNPILKPLYDVACEWLKVNVINDDKYLSEIDESRKNFKLIKYGELSEMNNVLVELPYVGYYDVSLTLEKHTYSLSEGKEVIVENTSDFKKFIKVEPYDIDVRGFFYDSRDIDTELKLEGDEQQDMEKFILDTLDYLTYIAKHDGKQLLKKYNEPGGYDLQMVMNKYLNKINEQKHFFDINNGPYAKQNFNFGDYIIQDGEFIVDNINSNVVNLIPSLKTAKYIKNGVNVKPYTWIYLTFDFSKIVHRSNPEWTLLNKSTGKTIKYNGKYFTCLLRDEGNYVISLTLYDEFGNKYVVDKNIIVVSENANYDTYKSFTNEYKAHKEYQKYKEQIKEDYIDYLENVYVGDEGNYIFLFNELKVYDSEKFIEHVKENTSRLTIKTGLGIGWGYDSPCNVSKYDKLNIKFDNLLPYNDNLSIYIVDNLFNYFEYKVPAIGELKFSENKTIQDIIINLKDLKNIDLKNISYIIFFNNNKDDNNIEINIENIYFSYNN